MKILDGHSWPDPGRSGYPRNPHAPGYHWVQIGRSVTDQIVLWVPQGGSQAGSYMLFGSQERRSIGKAAELWKYIAPVAKETEIILKMNGSYDLGYQAALNIVREEAAKIGGVEIAAITE